MKYLFGIFLLLLPFHALLETTLKCKIGIDTDIIRFWKEIFIGVLLAWTFITILIKNNLSLKKIFAHNALIGVTTAFILCSFLYIFFPYFTLKPASLLGFKYDVFFLFAMIIGFYSISLQKNFDFILKHLFIGTGIMLIVFLPWYLSGNINSMTTYFGYSDKVSTYEADGCLSYSQNVDGHNRLQGTFGGPIRFSVFIVMVYFLFIGFILNTKTSQTKKYTWAGIISLIILTGIFYSYSKTSFLGFIFGATIFVWLVNKFKHHKHLVISKKMIYLGSAICIGVLTTLVVIKKDLFLHLGAIINRLDNLSKSVEMFFYNPIGYGLGIAGPASQIGRSIESAGGWGISTANPNTMSKFLPENWYIQILLEQGIIGFSLFIALLVLIGIYLYEIIKRKKDFFSIGIFTSYISLVFMGLFTHNFEESATSYSLFLLIGAYISIHIHTKFKK